MGCSFVSKIQKAVGAVARPVAQIASVVPGWWQVPALAATAVDNAVHGNVLGAIAAGVGAYGAGGGFTPAGFDISKLTNPGGLFTSPGAVYSGSGVNPSAGGLSPDYSGSGIRVENPTALSSVGLSASGQPLYSAAQLATTFPNAFTEDELASLGGGLFTQQELASRFPTAYGSTATSGGITDTVGNLMSKYGTNILASAANLAGGYLQGRAAQDAAATSAQAQIEAARIAADAAKFRPVGITTNFGASQFGYDQNGNLISAGYSLNPQLKAQQNQLMGMTGNLLNQYQNAQTATAPMGQAANTMMALGNSYLSTTPQQQAQKYMEEQQALLASSRANQLADIRERLNALGRGGLAIGGGDGEMATNPEYAAYYNALRQQDLDLAARATQAGMDYARFGRDMVNAGGNMLNSMYGTQSAAFNPYNTALGGAVDIEKLGQNAMDAGINIGAKGTASNAQSGLFLANGLTNAARTMEDVNKISPLGTALQSGYKMLSDYLNPNYGKPTYDPTQFRLVPFGS
jgi:hypothetical protein